MSEAVEFLQMEFTAEDQERLGKEVTSAFLVLALAAEEIMQLLHLWIMAMDTRPRDPVFFKVATTRSHMLLRLVNVKVYEAHYAWKGFEIALKRKQKSADSMVTAERISAIWKDGLSSTRGNKFFELSKEMRNKMGGHCGTSDVEKWMDSTPQKAERKFLFHETKANSMFPAVDDLVFSAFLNFQFQDSYGDGTNQQKFERFLIWLKDAANNTVVTFHQVSVAVFYELLERDSENIKVYECEDSLVGRYGQITLPIYFHNREKKE